MYYLYVLSYVYIYVEKIIFLGIIMPLIFLQFHLYFIYLFILWNWPAKIEILKLVLTGIVFLRISTILFFQFTLQLFYLKNVEIKEIEFLLISRNTNIAKDYFLVNINFFFKLKFLYLDVWILSKHWIPF